jgi:hypothetical protein
VNALKVLITILLMCFFNPVYAQNTKKLTQQDFALTVCLDDNYEKINAYQRENLKDYSFFKNTLNSIWVSLFL